MRIVVDIPGKLLLNQGMATHTNTAPARRSQSIARLRAEMDATSRTLAGYHAMLDIAKAHGMEYETERIRELLAEYGREMDDVIERAAALGLGPEDFA